MVSEAFSGGLGQVAAESFLRELLQEQSLFRLEHPAVRILQALLASSASQVQLSMMLPESTMMWSLSACHDPASRGEHKDDVLVSACHHQATSNQARQPSLILSPVC